MKLLCDYAAFFFSKEALMASTSTFLMVGLRSNCLIALTLLVAIARFRRALRFNSVTAMSVYVLNE